MRIFHVNGDRGIAPDGTKGASVHRRHLIAAMRERGHDVAPFSRGAGADTIQYDDAFDVVSHARSAGSPDILYERYSIGHLSGLHAAESLGVPLVLEVNSPLLIEAERHRGYVPKLADVAAEIDLFRRASIVRVVSGWLADYVAQRRGHRRRVEIIGNGHDPDVFPAPPTFTGPPTIAFLGHPRPWHGAERLAPLLAAVRAAGLDARLEVIGGGEGADRVAEAASEMGLRDSVRITGPLSHGEVSQHLSAAWVGVAPYPPTPDFYFSPLKIVDYLGAGLPVVASDLGDVAAMIGSAGTVVDPGDDRPLTQAVLAYLGDPNLARSTGVRGRARARTSMTWPCVVERIEQAIDATSVGVAL
jgi:glycosyltransferase involved in cell wall biosynthesis